MKFRITKEQMQNLSGKLIGAAEDLQSIKDNFEEEWDRMQETCRLKKGDDERIQNWLMALEDLIDRIEMVGMELPDLREPAK